MNFIKHSDLEGLHAILGASKYHWINYDEDKMADVFFKQQASKKGTELHEFAAQCIKLNQKLPKSRKTLNMYVNDCINYCMIPEQVLFYSNNCFGTADAISFRNNLLRIHDYKSGTSQAHMEQLFIYAALFCLEYNHTPESIKMELRIYQNNSCEICKPEPEVINYIIEKIKTFDALIEKLRRN